MAERNIKLLDINNSSIDSAELSADFRSAEKIGKLRLGGSGVYFRAGVRHRYLPYDGFDRAFRRIEPVSAKLCCGRASFDIHRLVLVNGNNELADIVFNDENQVSLILERLGTRSGIAIGVKQS